MRLPPKECYLLLYFVNKELILNIYKYLKKTVGNEFYIILFHYITLENKFLECVPMQLSTTAVTSERMNWGSSRSFSLTTWSRKVRTSVEPAFLSSALTRPQGSSAPTPPLFSRLKNDKREPTIQCCGSVYIKKIGPNPYQTIPTNPIPPKTIENRN